MNTSINKALTLTLTIDTFTDTEKNTNNSTNNNSRTIAMWDLGELQSQQGPALNTVLRPAYYGTAHTDGYPIRSLAFNPHDPQQFVSAGQDGYLMLWDLRDPHQPIFSNKLSSEPLLSVQWLPDHPNRVLITVRNLVRIVSLASCDKANKEPRTQALKPQTVLVVGEHVTPWAFSACITPDRVFFAAVAYSDGQVNVFTVHADTVMRMKSKDVPMYSRGLSVTRTVPTKSEVEEAREVTEVTELNEEEEEKEAKKETVEDADGMGGAGEDRAPQIVLSGGFPLEYSGNRKTLAQTLKNRSGAKRTKLVPPLTPSELALDDWTAVLTTRINPNFHFPRWVVSGGLSGIVRCQMITDL
jgi:hypothetical protein